MIDCFTQVVRTRFPDNTKDYNNAAINRASVACATIVIAPLNKLYYKKNIIECNVNKNWHCIDIT